ncbi:MAG: hydrogenase nickel incorporation protein HypB [Phycisphaerae bacterium]
MRRQIVPTSTGADASDASAVRDLIRGAGAFAVNLVGGAGCGKTSLIKATVERLILDRRIGVITADPGTRHDFDRLAGCAERVVQVETGPEGALRPGHVRAALGRFDLGRLDFLLIENVSSLIGPERFDLGQDATACVFSVAAGDDKAAKYPAIVRMADVVLLNKTDLLDVMRFDVPAFRAGVRRLNPAAPLLELSTLRGDGLDAWLAWLREGERGAKCRRGRMAPGGRTS